MNAREISEFSSYLKNCTDSQVRGVYDKECAAKRYDYAAVARLELERRNLEI